MESYQNNKTKEPVSLFLPNRLITEEPWKTYLEAIANSCKGAILSENGMKLYLDSEDVENLASSLVLKSCKQGLTLKKSPTS